jgi:hypothetical protein
VSPALVNKFGLSRYIPAHVKREIRRRSRFGCVICRRGFYEYEHIDPPFEQAEKYDPDRMCCLCGSCHKGVTLRQISKEFVFAAYRRIASTPINRVQPPSGPLDFHTGTAELSIGRLLYSPAVQTVLRYDGDDVIRVIPSKNLMEPGSISARFTDPTAMKRCALTRMSGLARQTRGTSRSSGQP